MFRRTWVQIPAPYTAWTWHFFTLICCKNCIVYLKKTENKWKRGRGWPIYFKKPIKQRSLVTLNRLGWESIITFTIEPSSLQEDDARQIGKATVFEDLWLKNSIQNNFPPNYFYGTFITSLKRVHPRAHAPHSNLSKKVNWCDKFLWRRRRRRRRKYFWCSRYWKMASSRFGNWKTEQRRRRLGTLKIEWAQCNKKCMTNWAVAVVAQLAEWSLSIPRVRSSNPVIGNFNWTNISCSLCVEKTKITKKIAGMVHFLKKTYR